MHRLLERLDGAASNLVPMLYLGGLMLGTMAYFTGVTLDLGLAVGTALAFAAEMHLFLQMRRVRGAYGQVERLPEDDERRDTAISQFRVNLAILIGLILFSTYNSIAFVAETFHPAPGFLSPEIQIAIRGGVIPALFLLAGFLTPLAADASVLLRAASHAMLHRTIKRATRQWSNRIDKAYRSGNDLAPVAIALMEDAGDHDGARRVQLIADGLARMESSIARTSATPNASGTQAMKHGGQSDQTRPPTGPGSPSSSHVADEAPDQAGSGAADSSTDRATAQRRKPARVAPFRLRAKAADEALNARRRAFVNEQLSNDSHMTPNALANAIEAAGLGGCTWRTASNYKRQWQARQRMREQVAQ